MGRSYLYYWLTELGGAGLAAILVAAMLFAVLA